MEKITSKDNRWIKEFAKLSSLKSHRDDTGLFALESVKLLREAFQSGIRLSAVLVTERCLEQHEEMLTPILAGSPSFLIDSDLEKKLSLQKNPQGIYGIGVKLDKTLSLDTIKTNGKYVMLCDLQDAGNVGTIVRTAEALGISGIVTTKGTCDFYNPKVIRGSMGSVFRMPFLVAENAGDFLIELSRCGVQTCASVLDSDAVSLDEMEFREPSVLLIGNEGNGLPQSVADVCSRKVTIRMAGKTESLNASMAACILLWEMTKRSGI